MKLTVLMDNNTLIDRYFLGEPGLSFLLTGEEKNILFDTGYSSAFLENATKMGLNMLDIDFIVLSHGHLDHTWGLEPLSRKFMENVFEGNSNSRPVLVAHPAVFDPKYEADNPIGMNLSKGYVKSIFNLNLSKEPLWITDKLLFLGEIPRQFSFENEKPIGIVKRNGVEEDDYLRDDSALVYLAENGLVLITGCSHAGICNIIAYAQEVTGIDNVKQIIGGFHLLNPDSSRLDKTVEYISTLNLNGLYPCHCTDFHSKHELARKVVVKEVGVGLELEI